MKILDNKEPDMGVGIIVKFERPWGYIIVKISEIVEEECDCLYGRKKLCGRQQVRGEVLESTRSVGLSVDRCLYDYEILKDYKGIEDENIR